MNGPELCSILYATLKQPGTRFTYEWGLFGHEVRADLATLGDDGSLGLYEVKGDADNLKRLPQQAAMYSKVANRCGVAVGESYVNKLDAVCEIVPPWWDVYVHCPGMVQNERRLYHYRYGAENPAPDRAYLARLLWRDELGEVLKAHGEGGWSKQQSAMRAKRLAWLLTAEELRADIVPYLRKRTFTDPPK